MNIPAAIFKAECLKLMDEVARTGRPVVITKHGRPVAQLVPIPAEPKSGFGYMRDTGRITGDGVAPRAESWHAADGTEDALYGASRKSKRTRRTRAGK